MTSQTQADGTGLPPGPTAGDREQERAGARSALLITIVGVVVTLVLYVWIARLQSQDRSPAALSMSSMGMSNMSKYWSFPVLQASGLAGLLFAYLTALLGLQQSGRAVSWFPLSYRQIDRAHRQLSLLVIGLVAVHVLATALDAMGDGWKSVLVPGQWASQGWPQAVWGYNTGIFAVYVLILVAPTFYLRRMVGLSRWRFVHRFVLVFYGLSVWHALILGLDVGYYSWVRPLIWLLQIPLLVLLIRRLRSPLRSDRKITGGRRLALLAVRHGLQVVSAAAIVAIVALLVTHHSGFIATV